MLCTSSQYFYSSNFQIVILISNRSAGISLFSCNHLSVVLGTIYGCVFQSCSSPFKSILIFSGGFRVFFSYSSILFIVCFKNLTFQDIITLLLLKCIMYFFISVVVSQKKFRRQCICQIFLFLPFYVGVSLKSESFYVEHICLFPIS